ncbi:type II secretion system F family protein [Zavarzinia sp. CC-PAN008]|uniref:type II secretion system F family protein n=1 Tax=Zavarzinia sp. CC-PAN008 TaxID=3243332 RepID=UPI003F74AC7A
MIAGRGAHVLIFGRQFASMIRSGLQLVAVLENLARETPNRPLREAVRDIVRQVSNGTDLADAMARHPQIFNGVFVGLVRTGMESGRLSEALYQIVEYLERVNDVNRRVLSAAAYPLFLLVMFVGTITGMMFFILPQYEKVFKGFNRELPGPTRFLLDLGVVIEDNGLLIASVAGVVLAGFVAWIATPAGRLHWDRVKMRVPVVGPIWRLAALARFSRTLAVQVSNHISVVRALRLAAAAAGNRHVEVLALGMASDIESGVSVARVFREQELFAGIVAQMVASGEEAGQLDELLLSAAVYFDSLLVQRIDTVTSLVNPTMTAVMGAAISGMMIAAFLPVFDLPGAMG